MDVLYLRKEFADRFLDIGVEMDRIDDIDIRVFQCDLFESGTDIDKPLTVIFTAVAGDQNQLWLILEC